MIIKRNIKLNNTQYYITVDCLYKSTRLCLKNYNDDYYDSGDLSLLIREIEQQYNCDLINKKYKTNIPYINDILYIYDNIPFINGAGDIYSNSESYISKFELDDFIKKNNIKMNNQSKFKLSDGRTWHTSNWNKVL